VYNYNHYGVLSLLDISSLCCDYYVYYMLLSLLGGVDDADPNYAEIREELDIIVNINSHKAKIVFYNMLVSYFVYWYIWHNILAIISVILGRLLLWLYRGPRFKHHIVTTIVHTRWWNSIYAVELCYTCARKHLR